jgi:hypothetical protein
MPDVKLTPFTGIDNVTGEPSLPPGALVDALNVDVTRDGGLERRAGYEVVLAGAQSVGASHALNRLLVVVAGSLIAVDPESYTQTLLGPVADSELECVDVNDEAIVAGPGTLGVVRAGALQGLGVEVPAPPFVAVVEEGGLRAGRYGVLLTWLAADGEESAASAAVFVDVPESGGISIEGVPVAQEPKTAQLRAYRTGCDGDVFYRVDSVAPGAILGEGRRGRVCDTRHMERMRGGRFLRHWRGRIIVARGRNLFMSEPMRYGLTDPRHGFVQMPTRITFLQPVEGGIFVGQTGGVLFLDGEAPDTLKVVRTGAAAPTPGTAIEVNGSELTGDFVQGAQKHAVWWGARGYAVGAPSGAVVEPQSQRLSVPVGQRGASVVHERRLVSLVY